MAASVLPKYLEISRKIESQLVSGKWGTKRLPSARQVAETHAVSLVTASRALQVLRDKGLIRTVERSGSYLASVEPGAPAGTQPQWAIYLRSTPGPWQQASIAMTHGGFTAEARDTGVTLHGDLFEIREKASLEELKRQAHEAAERGITGVFFMPSRFDPAAARDDELFVESCRSEGLAVVFIERNLRGRWRPLECDLIATDDLDGGYRCTEHLLSAGRKRVAFVTGSPTSSHEGRLAGYLSALQHRAPRSGKTKFQPLVLEQPSGLPTKAAYETLADRILALRVDGVVCYQDYTAIGLIVELLTRGSKVPKDVAITGFDNLPIGNSFALGVTTYAFPAQALAQQAFRVMRWRIEEPDAPKLKAIIPGELIVRESTVAG